MASRSLTPGEIAFLQPIFGSTLPYYTQTVDTNDFNLGGYYNSITPDGTPYFSNDLYVPDFSDSAVPVLSKWMFIHEFTHVWQVYHDTNPIVGAIAAWLEAGCCYDNAYFYDLSTSADFGSYNIESQASIVADYWYVTQSLDPRKNTGSDKSFTTYRSMIGQVENAGPPVLEALGLILSVPFPRPKYR